MPSENPVLSSTTVVWGEWAAWPLEAPGGYFCFPDNKETHAGLSQPSPSPPQGRGEKQGRGPATVREVRGEAGSGSLRGGLVAAHLGKLGGRARDRASVRGSGEGAFRGWDGIWIHLIRSEEWLMIHKRSSPTEVDKLPRSLQQSWRTYLVRKFSLNQDFMASILLHRKREIISNWRNKCRE